MCVYWLVGVANNIDMCVYWLDRLVNTIDMWE